MSLMLMALLAVLAAGRMPEPTPPPFGELTFDPRDYPVDITDELQCNACYAAVKELDTRAPTLSRIKDKIKRGIVLDEAFETFCHEGNFYWYTGFPWEFVRNCETFLERFNDDSVVERRLLEGAAMSVGDRSARVCAEVCGGVPVSARLTSYTPPDMPMDGEAGGLEPDDEEEGQGGAAPQLERWPRGAHHAQGAPGSDEAGVFVTKRTPEQQARLQQQAAAAAPRGAGKGAGIEPMPAQQAKKPPRAAADTVGSGDGGKASSSDGGKGQQKKAKKQTSGKKQQQRAGGGTPGAAQSKSEL